MADQVLISKCLQCESITAAALICHTSDPADLGRIIVASVVDGRVVQIVDGPVGVSACRCASKSAGYELLELRAKVADLDRQLGNERYRRERLESKEPSERIKDLMRTAEILGETLTVAQLRDAIEGPQRALGAA